MLISSFVESLGSFRYRITSANRNNLTSSFLICILFIFLSCLIALARNSSTILNENGESRYPVSFPTSGEMVSVMEIPQIIAKITAV
jgi:hypothetical protein